MLNIPTTSEVRLGTQLDLVNVLVMVTYPVCRRLRSTLDLAFEIHIRGLPLSLRTLISRSSKLHFVFENNLVHCETKQYWCGFYALIVGWHFNRKRCSVVLKV